MARKIKAYTAAQAAKLSEKDLRRVYSKYAYEARRRAKMLNEKYGLAIDTGQFKALKDITETSDIALGLSSASKFLRGPSTLAQYREYRKKSILTLKRETTSEGAPKMAFDFINEKNFERFGEFMKEMRNAGVLDEYDSAEVAQSFGAKRRWSKKDIAGVAEAYKDNADRYDSFTDIVDGFIRVK